MSLNFKNMLLDIATSQFFVYFPMSRKLRQFVFKKVLKLDTNDTRFGINIRIRSQHETPDDFKKFKVNENGLVVGQACLFCKGVHVDTTGNVIMQDDVYMSEEVRVYTHQHKDGEKPNDKKKIVANTLRIDNNVRLGARSIVLHSCKHIGRYATIGASSVVRSNIPPYAIVMGNPAKVIGFTYKPEEMEEFEKNKYPEEMRTSVEMYTKLYNKLYLNRVRDISRAIML